MKKSISKKQLLDDVKELEEENEPTPETLQRDLVHAAKNEKSIEQQTDETLITLLQNMDKYGSSRHPSEFVRPLDSFWHKGFFLQVFEFGGKYTGWAREIYPGLEGYRTEFESLDKNTAYACGSELVNLVNIFRNAN